MLASPRAWRAFRKHLKLDHPFIVPRAVQTVYFLVMQRDMSWRANLKEERMQLVHCELLGWGTVDTWVREAIGLLCKQTRTAQHQDEAMHSAAHTGLSSRHRRRVPASLAYVSRCVRAFAPPCALWLAMRHRVMCNSSLVKG
jgi:hypothetical protein